MKLRSYFCKSTTAKVRHPNFTCKVLMRNKISIVFISARDKYMTQSTSYIQDLPDHPFQPTTFRFPLEKQLS